MTKYGSTLQNQKIKRSIRSGQLCQAMPSFGPKALESWTLLRVCQLNPASSFLELLGCPLSKRFIFFALGAPSEQSHQNSLKRMGGAGTLGFDQQQIPKSGVYVCLSNNSVDLVTARPNRHVQLSQRHGVPRSPGRVVVKQTPLELSGGLLPTSNFSLCQVPPH